MAIDDVLSASPRTRQNASRRSGKGALVFALLALCAGGASAVLFKSYLDSRALAVQEVQRIVVAAMDLPLATTLRPEHITAVEWPKSLIPEGAFTDAKQIVGR